MSARISEGNSASADRIRKRQDLHEQALATDRMLVAAISQPNAMRNQETEQALRARAATIADQIKELDRSIGAQFPEYSALVAKVPVSVEDVQRLLGPKEALLLFTTTTRFTFVWSVTSSDVRWHAAELGEKQLAETIGALRCGLDGEAWLDKGAFCGEELGLKRPLAPGEPLPFDQRASLWRSIRRCSDPLPRISTTGN